MPIYALGNIRLTLPDPEEFWIAPNAHVIGDVRIGQDVGIWFSAVIRGDNADITIGDRTNIQEGAMLHADPGFPLVIGKDCTIGHHAIVHGCTIGDGTLIGMGATILNGAKLGKNCLVGANTLVTEGKEFPDNSVIVGTPGKAIRELNGSARASLLKSAENYVANWKKFASSLTLIDG